MFHKIRVQLAAWNAIVFFIILLVSGISLYAYMQHRLYDQIDSSMRDAANAPPMFLKYRRLGDSPLVTLLWNESGTLLEQLPAYNFTDQELSQFKKIRERQDHRRHGHRHSRRGDSADLRPLLSRRQSAHP